MSFRSSFSEPPSHDTNESSNETPRKNNCLNRRETPPQSPNSDTNSLQQQIDTAENDDASQQPRQNEMTGPLSWNEARSRLKATMESWIRRQQRDPSGQTPNGLRNIPKRIDWDMALSILLSLAFVALSRTLPTPPDLPPSFAKNQRAASSLFLLSSLASAAIAHRRTKASETDRSIERRRCVAAFLEGPLFADATEGRSRGDDDAEAIPRKNVEDVYSAYRLRDGAGDRDEGGGRWHRIPALLLVRGDFVALKVGDSSPAECRSTNDNEKNPVVLRRGERLTLDLLGDDWNGRLPAGKSTVKAGEELLSLANGVRVFELMETPLETFLNKDDVVDRKVPQLIRQGRAVRNVLLRIAVISFFLASVILLIRPSVGPQGFFTSLSWTLPILSAISFLPISTPLYLFILECIGTARILATVHPFASNQKQRSGQNVSSSDNGKPGTRGVGGSSRVTSQEKRQVIAKSHLGDNTSADNAVDLTQTPPPRLTLRYFAATLTSRLKSSDNSVSESLLTIPPASLHLLEKLGAVTAIALIDDELACEPHSTPQQLLIPSKDGGLKLLDLCPAFHDDDEDQYSADDDEGDDNENERGNHNRSGRSASFFRKGADDASVDSDDEEEEETRFAHSFSAPARRLRRFRNRYGRKKKLFRGVSSDSMKSGCRRRLNCEESHGEDIHDVQFEDPQWWQFLPSLKCIGLSCMMIEGGDGVGFKKKTTVPNKEPTHHNPNPKVAFDIKTNTYRGSYSSALRAEHASLLVDHLCIDRERKQLRVLARCIGFSRAPNDLGPNGDLSSFRERRRLHIISSDLLRKRMQLKSHAMGLEESRNWSLLYTDADTVFVRDRRSGGDFVLTVGDARVVTELCPDWWQGENSTISPLTASDRQIINETQNNWMLSDLDVQAFSYAPLPYTADHKIGSHTDGDHVYLLDNSIDGHGAVVGGFWQLVRNQIFLGLLGSSVRPRKEIEALIIASADAGVRFVYFSPRNMRRTKELASQMGIDVAWNCAISLRPLEKGEDDTFRMTSNYADWDVNARLPHGVEDVKRHLKEVDNVPLLVSLYTDVTKTTTAEMVNVFQDYHDTVLSVGLSHLPGNHEIFSRADIAIGVDVLTEDTSHHINDIDSLQPAEVAFIASISAHSAVFNLCGSRATCHLLDIIRIGRASLESATSSALFLLHGLLSFGFFVVLCPCTVATVVPKIPALGSFLYTQIMLHWIGLSMASTDGDKDQMTRVPPKNDSSIEYTFKANTRWYTNLFLRSVPSVIFPHIIYLIALGELMWAYDSPFLEENCSVNVDSREMPSLLSILRCQGLKHYSGPSTIAASAIALASHAICTCVVSASFVFRTEPIWSEPPWKRNHQWLGSFTLSVILIAAYLAATLERGSVIVMPWYFFVLLVSGPFVCLWLSELVKKADQKLEKRAVMMRRLQFETRLGMWSPKESTHIGETPGNNFKKADGS